MQYPSNENLLQIYRQVEELTGLSRDHTMEVVDLVIDAIFENSPVEDY